MKPEALQILLADDDTDDCSFFKDALESLSLATHLTIVHDGEQLMHLLVAGTSKLPDVLFLDLNMPRKNGFECLEEIKRDKKFALLPIIVFSTSFDQDRVDLIYENGAHYFMRKPAEFLQLKNIIHEGLRRIVQDFSAGNRTQPAKESFVIM
ncbi:MAG: response regulator [Flavobacteriales bacterium]